MTHTPGPWDSNETGKAGDELACAVWTKAGYTPICTTDFRVGKYQPVTPTEQHANCRLIAAAPELLATLEGILAHAKNALESDGNAFIDEVHIVNVCETAIAKARGEE